jgi:hypothetical protein
VNRLIVAVLIAVVALSVAQLAYRYAQDDLDWVTVLLNASA